MQVITYLHKLLSKVTHQKRLRTLSLMVTGALSVKKLSVTQLGREISWKIQERSGIRRSDRLVGNKKLHGERKAIYNQVIKLLVGSNIQPAIIVDWSQVPNSRNHIIRAALVTKGRALTLYEEVYPEKKLGNIKVQNQFLKNLKEMLLEVCCPIIITDAGFHTPWFEQVKQLGWNYVGRVRGTYKYYADENKIWVPCTDLWAKATHKETCIGNVLLSKQKPLPTYLYLYKEKNKGRVAKNKAGERRKDKHSKKHSQSAKEPWVLVSSLGGTNFLHAKRVIKIYKKRMQIEESFRDLKSSRYGLSFEQSYSKIIYRIENLLLIAMLTCLIAWLVGFEGEKKGLHLEFQVNSIKNKRVLSLFFLGCQILKRGKYREKITLQYGDFNLIGELL